MVLYLIFLLLIPIPWHIGTIQQHKGRSILKSQYQLDTFKKKNLPIQFIVKQVAADNERLPENIVK